MNRGTYDVAGVDINGKLAAVGARDRASVLFSVTRATSPAATRMLHEAMVLAPGQTL